MSRTMRSSLRVAVRCRPLLPGERDHRCSRISLDADEGKVFVSGKSQEDARCFSFDRVFLTSSTQEDVMCEVAPLIDHALNGFHATVFAYGQTGSGKTHTVEGIDYVRNGGENPKPDHKTDPHQHGIIPRAIQLVFDRARGLKGGDGGAQFQFHCSFYQIYNERVTDLLNPSTTQALGSGLKVSWRRGDVFVVENLFLGGCDGPEKMRRFFFAGTKQKAMGIHAMNEQSSRSHCVFTIHITRWDVDSPDTPVKSEFSIVDLAGSEKLTLLSKSPSVTLVQELIEINASLLALGKVITALANASKRKLKGGESRDSLHIPYRESKLTMLLKHALGGNSLTTMIACINPSDRYTDESLSTLLYASRARNIVNVPRVNESTKSALIRQLREEVASLRKELQYYRTLATGTVDRVDCKPSLCIDNTKADGDDRREELADNLIQACMALKNIMAVNAQLRDAFDTVKQAKLDVEKRELELNAENLALRERIEMLESIVLRNEFVKLSSSDIDVLRDEKKETESLLLSCGSFRKEGIFTPVEDVLRVCPSSARLPVRTRSAEPKLERWASCRNGKKAQKGSISLEPSSTGNRVNSRRRASSTTGRNREDGGRITSIAEERRQKERRRRYNLALKNKLEEYTNRFCGVNRFVNYADYYGKAQQQIPKNGAALTAIKEVEKTLKQLPLSIVEAIPQSLKLGSQFGSLSFGGTPEEVAAMDQRRQQREERREALLAQQQALRQNVARAFTNVAEKLDSLRQAGTPTVVHQPYADVTAGRTKAIRSRTSVVSSTTPASYGTSRLRAYLDSEEAKGLASISSFL